MEKFNPFDPEYKKVEDLPTDQQENYKDVPEGGFITSEAADENERNQRYAKVKNEDVPFLKRPFTKKLRPADVAQPETEYEYKEELEKRRKQLDVQRQREAEEQARIEFHTKLKVLEQETEAKMEALLENSAAVVEKIQAGGIGAVAKIYKDLAAEENKFRFAERGGFNFPDDQAWEAFMNLLMAASLKTKKPYAEVFNASSDTFIALEDRFSSWSHTLCHLFEKYTIGDKGDEKSLLYFPENFGTVEKLIDEDVKRAVAAGDMGNSGRIIGPLITYNVGKLEVAGLDDSFPFRPESLSEPAFIALADESESKYDPERPEFLKAKTPRKFLGYLVKNGEKLNNQDPQTEVAILQAIEKDFSPEEWSSYISKHYTVNGEKISLEQIAANAQEAESAVENVEGVYIDVDGTLVENGVLNVNVMKRVGKEFANGKSIVIFTGADPEARTEQLRALGVPDIFLPVRSKDDFKGKVLEYLIDDTKPEYQGFKAKKYQPPGQIW